jgi:hypothetical protein
MEVGSFIGHFFKSSFFMFQVQVQLFCQLLLLLMNLTTTDMTQFSQQFLKVAQKGSKAVAEGSADIIINRTKEMHVSDSQKIVPPHRFRHVFKVTILPWQNVHMDMRHSLSCFWAIVQRHQIIHTRSD